MFAQISVATAILSSMNPSPASAAMPAQGAKSMVVLKAYSRAPMFGRVVSESGAPVVNAIVSLMVNGRDTVVTTTRTDVHGDYRLSVPVEGSYVVRIICLGYKPVVSSLTRPVPGDVSASTITMHSFEMESQMVTVDTLSR